MPAKSRGVLWATMALLIVTLVAGPASGGRRFRAPILRQYFPTANSINRAKFAITDVNDDGVPDVVGPGYPDVALGRGDGTLAFPVNVAASPRVALCVGAGDFDGDGHRDVAWAGWNGLGVAYGDGTGLHWWPITVLPKIAGPLEVADVDGDGRDDLVTLTSTNGFTPLYLTACLSRPNRTFTIVPTRQDSLPAAYEMVSADMNGDGHVDLVTYAAGSPTFVEFLGRGDGTFTSRGVDQEDDVGDPSGLAIGDLNADGILDLALARTWQITIVPGLGDGTFGRTTNLLPYHGPRCYGLAIDDVTGDGIDDLVYSHNSDGASIVTRAGSPAGLASPRTSTLGHFARPIRFADMDGDERVDLVALEPESGDYTLPGVMVVRGDGAGGFGESPGPALLDRPFTPYVAADMDRDGDVDIVGNDGTQWQVLLGRADGAYDLGGTVARPANLGGVTTCDFDHDGTLDLVSVYPNDIGLSRGRGDGTLEPWIEIGLPTWGPVAFSDVTGDSIPDIVQSTSGVLRTRKGDGHGGFGPGIDTAFPYSVHGLALGDLDGDGGNDAAVVIDNAIRTVTGRGDGTFAVGTTLSATGASWVIIKDIDSDGRSDVMARRTDCGTCATAVLDTMERISTWLQRSDHTLGPRVDSGWPASYTGEVQLGDADGDGHQDLLYAAYGFGIAKGDGAGHFRFETGYDGATDIYLFADVDRDGRPDVLGCIPSPAGMTLGRYFGCDSIPPTALLLDDPTPEPLLVGQVHGMHWECKDDVAVSSIDLFVSRHGPRGPFERIATDLPNTGQAEWTVSGPPSYDVAFKLVSRDTSGNIARVVSPGWLVMQTLAVDQVSAVAGPTITSVLPMPMRQRVTVTLALPKSQRILLDLVDVAGRRVAQLFDGMRAAGPSQITWSNNGQAIAPGLYFVRLVSGAEHTSTRVVLVR